MSDNETFVMQLYQRVPGTTNAVRADGDPETYRTLGMAGWRGLRCLESTGDENAVFQVTTSRGKVTWYSMGMTLISSRDVPVVVVITPCFIYDGPENLTRADLPPGVIFETVIIEKEYFQAVVDDGDHILVERVEADLLHKAYMIGKGIERERAEVVATAINEKIAEVRASAKEQA